MKKVARVLVVGCGLSVAGRLRLGHRLAFDGVGLSALARGPAIKSALLHFSFLLLTSAALAADGGELRADYVDRVDVFIGTQDEGNVFPGACRPFGLVQASPDTGKGTVPPGYKYNHGTIRGFSQTHLNGTGCPALGDISLMPFAGDEPGPLHLHAYDRVSEKGAPDLYAVTLDNGVKVRGTAAQRVGFWQFTYETDESKHLYFDAASSLVLNPAKKYGAYVPESSATLVPARDEIRGYRRTKGWADRKVFYCARFSRPWTKATQEPRDAFEGKGERFVLDFGDLKKGETLEARVAVSTVSEENAAANLALEGGWDVSFETVRAATRKAWNDLLGRVEAEGTADELKSFYTSLYHLCIQPNDLADSDGRYRGAGDVVKTAPCGSYYSTLSLWDTYRAAHPLYTILCPERVEGFVETMAEHGRAHGHLPVWTLWGGETHDMIGIHSIPVMVDAYFKGFGGVDWNEALDLMVTSLTKAKKAGGCYEMNVFWENGGYYPYRPGRWDEDWTAGGSCSRTLEFCYDWWCVAKLAEALGHERTRQRAAERAAGWQKIFDTEIGFIRPKGPSYQGAEWRTPFDPRLTRQTKEDFHGDFTEGNSWQYTWHVFQDPDKLAELMGGREKAIAKLDEMFRTEPVRSPNDHFVGGLEHGQIGQLWHGNEPSHHIAYLYSYYGAPRKTAKLVRDLCSKCYRTVPAGLCGNDDCGQMSAWYLFSVMGFYPMNPCGGEYVIGAPQLSKVVLSLPRGKKFTVSAVNLSKENLYVKSMRLNGRSVLDGRISHADIMAGGELEFVMCGENTLGAD